MRETISATTLMERGVAVPFTTPMLTGARIRPIKGGVEIVVANPSGGRGSYVFDLRMLPDFCTLTVHDRLLLDGLVESGSVSPQVVRRVSRQIARSGAAGRDAARASEAALTEEDGVLQMTNLLMIMKLLQQAEIPLDLSKVDVGSSDFRRDLRGKLGSFAPQLGITANQLFAAVDEISALAAPIGFTSGEFTGRHEHSLNDLRGFLDSIERWSVIESGDLRETCEGIVTWARSTLSYATPALAESQQMFEDLRKFLLIWVRNPGLVRERFDTIDWLLDGCPEICTLWRSVAAEPRSLQASTVYQIGRMFPSSSSEDRSLIRSGSSEESWQRSRWVKLNEDWRTGVIGIEAQERQEALRAQVA